MYALTFVVWLMSMVVRDALSLPEGIGVFVAVGGTGVRVGVGVGVFVAVGGTGVFVAVGGTGVGVFVG